MIVRLIRFWCLVACWGLPGLGIAAEQVFPLSGGAATLRDRSAEVDILYRSMRFNRALDVWNVEVCVSNKSSRVIPGPMTLWIESYTNTSGLLDPDGQAGDPPKAFYELTARLPESKLAPGEMSQPRTLTLGVASEIGRAHV